MGVGSAEHDVGVKEVTKRCLGAHIALKSADAYIKANPFQMSAHHAYFWISGVQVCNPGAEHSADIGVSIEKVVVE